MFSALQLNEKKQRLIKSIVSTESNILCLPPGQEILGGYRNISDLKIFKSKFLQIANSLFSLEFIKFLTQHPDG